MKRTLALLAACGLLAAPGAAAPQAGAPAAPAAQPEPAGKGGTRLKLRLEDLDPSRPTIRFGQREEEKSPADSLPALGPSPARAFDRSTGTASPSSSSSSTASPFPKDFQTER